MFPKKGKVFPAAHRRSGVAIDYAGVIAAALRSDVGGTHQAIKTVMRWTGADERTIKNWFAGTNGPSGAHLVALFRYSDEVLEACLLAAGRERVMANARFTAAREKLRELLAILESLEEG